MIIVKLTELGKFHKYETRKEFENSLDFKYSNLYPEFYIITEIKIDN